jgi:FkbM family methyltransferase
MTRPPRSFLLSRRMIGLLPNRPKQIRSVAAYRLAGRETRGRLRIRLTEEAEGGVELDLDLADWLQRLYALGETDTGRRSLLRALLPAGAVLVDAGANIGLYTCTMAAHVGPAGHVFAFEPMAENVEALQRNLQLNNLTNVTVLPVALSDRAQRLELFAPFGHPGGSSGSISAHGHDNWLPVGSVDAVPLDAVFDGDRLDAIKLDVEGHEPEILRGAVNTLHRFRPTILCEVAAPSVLDVVLQLAHDLHLTPLVESRGRLEPFRRDAGTNDLFLIPEKRNR